MSTGAVQRLTRSAIPFLQDLISEVGDQDAKQAEERKALLRE